MPNTEKQIAKLEHAAVFAPSRVLVAEDNPTNQMVISALLTRLGLKPQAVANGAEALKALENEEYSLILMDLQMPEMDGLEATRRVREKERTSGGRRLPIVALTANVTVQDRERCEAAGMDGFLAKPVIREILITELEKHLPPKAVMGP